MGKDLVLFGYLSMPMLSFLSGTLQIMLGLKLCISEDKVGSIVFEKVLINMNLVMQGYLICLTLAVGWAFASYVRYQAFVCRI